MKKLVLIVRSYFANTLGDAFKTPIISLRGKDRKVFRGKLVGAKW